MTRELRDGENRTDEHTRRNVLKAAGGVASALAGVAAMGSVGAQTSNTVGIVSEGADDTGETSIDDVLQSAVESNTEVTFPKGTYRLGGFAADGLQDVSVEGFTFDYTAPNTAT